VPGSHNHSLAGYELPYASGMPRLSTFNDGMNGIGHISGQRFWFVFV
jgi:hypothetical protein